MKNITLSADPDLIEKARQVAKSENTTLNAAFREWLESYVRQRNLAAHRTLRESLKHINAGGPYTRDEMNER
jgi:predicted transcriptional regulator